MCLLLFYISLKKFMFHRVCFGTKPLCETLGDHLSKWDKAHWLSVIIMSRTSFRVNLHSILCLNVKELLAGSRCFIWSLIENNGIRTHNHLVRKRTLHHDKQSSGIYAYFPIFHDISWPYIKIITLLHQVLKNLFLKSNLDTWWCHELLCSK